MKYKLLVAFLLITFTINNSTAQYLNQSKLYLLDMAHSEIRFSMKYLKGGKVSGTFERVQSMVYADHTRPLDLSASIVIDVNSINTGIRLRDLTLKKDWFDTSKYPKIIFETLPLKPTDKKGYISGNLTIKGITKKVTLRMTEMPGKPILDHKGDLFIALSGTTTINRKDFNVTMANSSYEKVNNGIKALPDEIQIDFQILLIKLNKDWALRMIGKDIGLKILDFAKTDTEAVLSKRLDSIHQATKPEDPYSNLFVAYYLSMTGMEDKIGPLILKSYEYFPKDHYSLESMIEYYYLYKKDKEKAKKYVTELLALDKNNLIGWEYKKKVF